MFALYKVWESSVRQRGKRGKLSHGKRGVVSVCKHTALLFSRRIATEQQFGGRGRNFFLSNDRAKWTAVLTESGSTCGETDFMQFDQTNYRSEAVSVSSLPFSLVLFLSLSVSHNYLLVFLLCLSHFIKMFTTMKLLIKVKTAVFPVDWFIINIYEMS